MRDAQDLLNEELFIFNLSAFLSAWKSVPEVLLYDFAERFRIGFTLEDYMTDKEFGIAANLWKTQMGESDASDFLKWWRMEVDRLNNTHKLSGKRDILIHRGYPKLEKGGVERTVFIPTGTFQVYTTGVAAGWGTGSAILGETTAAGVQYSPETFGKAPADVKETYRFGDQQDRDIVDICKEAYDDMKAFAEEAQTEKWRRAMTAPTS